MVGEELLPKPDLITGFTAFHMAIFTQDKSMMELLIRLFKSDDFVEIKDNYSASPFDYARMLGMTNHNLFNNVINELNIWNPDTNTIEKCPVSKFEQLFKVKFSPSVICTEDYIEELMFSSLSISPDLEFREKYSNFMYNTSGDENLILSKISDEVGWGVFAAKDFKEGDFIVRYGGCLTSLGKAYVFFGY
jgi:hypothetical protein